MIASVMFRLFACLLGCSVQVQGVWDQSKCDCCDEFTLQAYAGELNRHCFPASLLRQKEDIIVAEAADGSPTVPQEALEILCASALCRSSVLRFWARVRGCSESSSWKRYGFAWAAAKVRCLRLQIPEEEQSQDGERYQVLMQATFGHEAQAMDSGSLEATSTAIKQALRQSLRMSVKMEDLRVQLAMAAYGPPVGSPIRFQLATPQITNCPQLVTAFPWDGEVKVKPQLEYIVLHFDRCVRLHMQLSATLYGRGSAAEQNASRRLSEAGGFRHPSLSDEVCSKELIPASLPVSEAEMPGRTLIFKPDSKLTAGCCYRFHLDMEAVGSCNTQTALCQDLKIDFCVEWPPPQPAVRLDDDHVLEITFSVPVKLNVSNDRIQLEAGPEEGEGGVVTAWHLLERSHHSFWQLEYGNLTHSTVKDNADATGLSMVGEKVYCAYSKYGKESGGQPCNDHRSFRVDMCSVSGNCPDQHRLPCGMILKAFFPPGLASNSGVQSLGTTIVRRTRECDPPHLLNSLRIGENGKTLFFSWSIPALVADPMATISLCGNGPSQCVLEGVRISDERISPCITGPNSCTEWALDLGNAGEAACGQLSLQVEAGAVRTVRNKDITSRQTAASVTHPIPCGVAADEPARLKCLQINDEAVLQQGPSNENFLNDLEAAHIDALMVDRRTFLRKLQEGPKDTPCAIIPKVTMKFWNGAERTFFDYVQRGGQLYIIGGHYNRDILSDVFGLNVRHGHSGNVQHLQNFEHQQNGKSQEHQSARQQLQECAGHWLRELPVLNAMNSVKLSAMHSSESSDQVWVTGLYSSHGTFSETNSFGVVEVTLGKGLADYLAFDWYDDSAEERRPWAMQLALLTQCNKKRMEVNEPSFPGDYSSPVMRDNMQRISAAAPMPNPGMPRQHQISLRTAPYSDTPSFQHSAWQPGKHQEPRQLQEIQNLQELGSLDAWKAASPVTNQPVEPDIEVSVALACDRTVGKRPCDDVREKMLEILTTADSDFYASLLDDGITLDLTHFAPPHIIKVLSQCPPIQRIEDAVLTMNAACGFRSEANEAESERFSSSTAFLREHVIQSRLGVEVLTKALRTEVCRRPLCRGQVLQLRKLLTNCGEGAGHKSVIARIVGAVDTSMDSCIEVHSANQGDASHSQVSSGGSETMGVWSSDMSEVNHVIVKGIDTGSHVEMRAVEEAVSRILSDEMQLPLYTFEERGGSFADIFDPLLGGPNVLAVGDSNLRVAASIAPMKSAEPFDEPVGVFAELKDMPVRQNPEFDNQHNLQMLAIQPGWNEQDVDPSFARIRIIFEEIVAKDDASAVVRVFPAALKDICLRLKVDDPLQWQMFPQDTGLGSLKPASAGDIDSAVGVPIGFLCHTISAGDDARVLASGEVLQIELQHPLLRNTEYVVMLPPRVVKAAMGSTKFPGALWEGWPNEEGQGNKEYVFTTGIPRASTARLSIAVSCSSEKECNTQRALVSEQGMEDLASRALCFAAWFRCFRDPISEKHCETPRPDMQWCDVHGQWASSWAPSHEEEESQLSGMPGQAVSEVQSIGLPSWVYVLAQASWVQGTFAALRAAWWVSDCYTQSRDFDPYVAQGSRALPLKACAVAMAVPLIAGLLGALVAAPLFRITVRNLWRHGAGGSNAFADVGRLHHQLATAFTVAFCASEAFTSVFAYCLIAHFKNWSTDKGQRVAISALCCAAASAAGAASGWVGASDFRQMTDPSAGLAWDLAVLLTSTGCSLLLSLALVPTSIFMLLWDTPGIGDILKHAMKFQFFQWREWWHERGAGSGQWSQLVLLIADIEIDEGFVSNMLNMGMDDGHLFLKFYCSDTRHDVALTRSHAVRWEGDDRSVQKFEGEDIFVNFTDPFTLLRVDVMFQEETSTRPECVASTIWDPWCTPLLEKYFHNFNLCHHKASDGDFWNPKDVFYPDGRPVPGVFLELELNLTRHRTECRPEMGVLRFHATHMGGFGGKRKTRTQPWSKPERLMALGDTMHSKDQTFWRRNIVEVEKDDFEDGKYHRDQEEEQRERQRLAQRHQLRHQLEHGMSPNAAHSLLQVQGHPEHHVEGPRPPQYVTLARSSVDPSVQLRLSPRHQSHPARTLEHSRDASPGGLSDWLNDTLDSIGL